VNEFEKIVARVSPAGVERCVVSEVATIEGRSIDPQRMSGDAVEIFSLPAYDGGQSPERVAPSDVGSAKSVIAAPCVLVAKLNPHIPRIWAVPEVREGMYCSPEFLQVVPGAQLCLRYLYYFFWNEIGRLAGSAKGGTNSHKRLQRADLLGLMIPVPPIELQLEIVRILDHFTELRAELEAEQRARHAQYAIYRQLLMDIPSTGSIRKVPMSEVLLLRAGKFIAASKIHPAQDDEHPYPCFGGNGLRGYVAEPNHEGDFVLIGRQGAWSGNVKRVTGKFYATEHAVVVTPIEEFNISWLFHKLTNMNLNQYVSQGAQPGLAVTALNKVLMPVPDVAEQNKTADMLDRFYALVNDVEIGLPAELNARRKQYEYYRDRLLTFNELAT
jgi:type I restriction enzyme, S subunit